MRKESNILHDTTTIHYFRTSIVRCVIVKVVSKLHDCKFICTSDNNMNVLDDFYKKQLKLY